MATLLKFCAFCVLITCLLFSPAQGIRSLLNAHIQEVNNLKDAEDTSYLKDPLNQRSNVKYPFQYMRADSDGRPFKQIIDDILEEMENKDGVFQSDKLSRIVNANEEGGQISYDQMLPDPFTSPCTSPPHSFKRFSSKSMKRGNWYFPFIVKRYIFPGNEDTAPPSSNEKRFPPAILKKWFSPATLRRRFGDVMPEEV